MYGNRIQELFTHGCLSSYQNVISAQTMPCPTIQLNTPTFWFWQHCELNIFSNWVFSAHEILLAGGWPKTEILSIRLLGSDNCPHRPSIDTYHSLKPEAFQILWPVLNQAFSGGSQWWWDTTLLSMGSLAIGIHHHENAEKCGFIRWRKQVQILHCINHQKRGRGPRMWKNVDYWRVAQTWQVGQRRLGSKDLDLILCTSPFDWINTTLSPSSFSSSSLSLSSIYLRRVIYHTGHI